MSSGVERVEVFSGIQRRRRYSADQKLAVLAEAAQPGMTISFIARRHGISPSLIFGWRRRMTEGGKEAVRADDEVVARERVRTLENQVRELIPVAFTVNWGVGGGASVTLTNTTIQQLFTVPDLQQQIAIYLNKALQGDSGPQNYSNMCPR